MVTGVVVAAVCWAFGQAVFAPLAGWSVAALGYVGLTWWRLWGLDAATTSSHATREVPRRAQMDLALVGASLASLAGIGVLLAGSASGPWVAVLTMTSVIASWSVVHTLYALRYARLYYVGEDGGVDFHMEEAPQYSDFAYMAFTVGMSFAISDTDLQSSEMRSTAIKHALLAYLFGTVFLAGLVNILAGLAH